MSLLFILLQVYNESDSRRAFNNLTQAIDEKIKGLQLSDEKLRKSDDGYEEVKDADLREKNKFFSSDSHSSDEKSKEIDEPDEVMQASRNNVYV